MKTLSVLKHPKRHDNKPLKFERQVIFLFFGIIAFLTAISWNNAITSWIDRTFKGIDEIYVSFIYAILITLLAILLLFILVKISDHYKI